MAYQLVTGDTGSTLQVTCRDNDTDAVIDLTLCTVTLRWEGSAGVVSKTMTKTSPTNGIAEYKFATGEIEAPKMKFEVEIVDGGSNHISSLELIEVEVREQLG